MGRNLAILSYPICLIALKKYMNSIIPTGMDEER
jgi:hypothetical protein